MADHDLLTAKISRGFDHLDLDGDGQLTEHDHVLMGWRVAASLGFVEGSPAEQRIVEAYLRIWRDLHVPHIADGATAISRERFLTSTRTLADNPVAAWTTLGALAGTFLAIADADSEGRIGPIEFLGFQRGHFPMLSQADADEAFAHLDRDGDGYLSATEFTEAIVEFWSSTDPDAPGNWWMGRP